MIEVKEPNAYEAMKHHFLEQSGYGDRDVLSWNPVTKRFMTRNGGQYQLTDTGKIIHLAGPSPDPEDRL